MKVFAQAFLVIKWPFQLIVCRNCLLLSPGKPASEMPCSHYWRIGRQGVVVKRLQKISSTEIQQRIKKGKNTRFI